MSSKNPTTALITASKAADVSFDNQLNAVESALEKRSSSEKLVVAHRLKCVDILTTHGIDLGGHALEPEDLERVLQRIVIMGKPPVITAEDRQIFSSSTANYFLESTLSGGAIGKMIQQAVGAKGIALAKHFKKLRDEGLPKAQEDKVATAKVRKEFTIEFAKFRSALEDYQEAATTIDNIKEYVGIVQDISSIASNTVARTKGKKR